MLVYIIICSTKMIKIIPNEYPKIKTVVSNKPSFFFPYCTDAKILNHIF